MNSIRESMIKTIVLFVICGLSVAFGVAAEARPLPASFDPAEMMPLSEVRPGMTGHLLTVYSGTALERSDVEILGVFPGFMAGRDLIVARLDIPWKDMGVIAGMSGSPVFINGRMIGAVAYGWGFSKEAIAGITPIEYMIDVYDQTLESGEEDDAPERDAIVRSGGSRGARAASAWSAARPWYKEVAPTLRRTDWQTQLESLGLGARDGRVEAAALMPLGLPLSVSSANPLTLELMRAAFSDYGLMPVSAGGAGGSTMAQNAEGNGGASYVAAPRPDDITHGSAVGVALMTGATSMAGIGTVTYRKGGKLVAFGHPMLQEGDSELPMTSAVITTVMPSYIRPFKLGYPGEIVGTLKQDRLPAIGGAFGPGPVMTPYRLSVAVDGRPAEVFDYQIVRNRDFMPFLAIIGVVEGLYTAADFGGDQTAEINYTVTLGSGEKITKEMFFSGSGLTAFSGAMDMMLDVGTLLFNPYEKTEVTALDFDVKIKHTMKQAQLWAARPNRDIYRPGDTVRLALFLQPYREKMEVRRVEMTLPADLSPGSYRVHVLSGNDRARLEASQNPGRFQMRDFEDVVRILNVYYPDNKAFVILERGLGLGGVSLEGEALQAPPSVKALLEETAPDFRKSALRGETLMEEGMTLDFVLGGSQTILIKVEKKKEEF